MSTLARVMHDMAGLGGLRSIRAEGRVGDTTSRPVLDDLDIGSFDHVIVLCESRRPRPGDGRRADARSRSSTSATSGRSWAAPSRSSARCSTCANRELAEVARADDFIVSARVLSLLLAQIAETPDLADVFRDLFDADGAEIYLRDAGEYVALDREIGFATLQAAAQARDEVALGYRVAARANDAAAAYGVVLNPARERR